MRDVIYAEGAEPTEGEEALGSAFDEDMLNKVMADDGFARSFYAERNRYFDRMSKWFFGQHYLDSVDNEDESPDFYNGDGGNVESEHTVTLQMPFTTVVRAHTMMTNEFPAFEVMNKGDNPDRENKVEKFLYGVHHINKERWGRYPMSEAIFNQLLYGWGVVRVTWQRREWEEDKSFKGDAPLYNFPIEVVSLNPDEVYPIPGGHNERWKAVIHRTSRRVWEVNDEFGVHLMMSDEQATDERRAALVSGELIGDLYEPLSDDEVVDVIDYWCWSGNKIYHCVVANNQFVVPPSWAKFYDQLPFVIFFCIDTTDKINGHRFGLSAIHGLVDSVAETEWLVNRHMAILDKYADPVTIVTRVNDEPLRGRFLPGEVVELVEGEAARYLQFDGVVPDVKVLEDFFLAMAQEDAFTIPRDGASGLDTVALQQAGMVKIFKPVENAEQAYEQVNSRVIGLLQHFSWNKKLSVYGRVQGDEDVAAFSVNVSGKDTKGLRQTQVRIRAKFPLEELRNVAAAATLYNSRLMQRPLVQKRFLNIQDTDASERALTQEDVKMHPALRDALIQFRVQSMVQQSTVDQVMAQEAERLAQRGEPSTQGTPQSGAPLGGQPDIEEQEAELRRSAVMGGNGPAGAPVADNPMTTMESNGY